MSNLLILAVSLLAPSLVPLPVSIQRTDCCLVMSWRGAEARARELCAQMTLEERRAS